MLVQFRKWKNRGPGFLTAGVLVMLFVFAFQDSLLAQSSEPKVPIEKMEAPQGAIANWQKSATEQSLQINLPVQKRTLENGLTVLLLEDHSVPMISYHTWYKVGSRNETPGVTGAAHMLEHLMFKGSEKFPGNFFEKVTHENGIEYNAFTSFDMTGFYETLPSSKLDLVMNLEVDRVRNLSVKEADLISEREVVKEERRWRVDNNPIGLMQEKIFGSLFKVHSYRNPVIGTMEDISSYTLEKLHYFYDNYYNPGNAILVLVGDFVSADVMKKIEKRYGRLPKKDSPQLSLPEEPEQTKATVQTLKQSVQAVTLAVAVQTIPIGHEDMYALDLLSAILGDGESSRLYRRLVYETELATSAYAYHMSLRDHGVFYLGASLRPKVDKAAVMQILSQETNRAITQKVTAAELAKAKARVMKNFVDDLETMDGKARALASAEIMRGDYQTLFGDLAKYQQVTEEDILRVGKKYLSPARRNITILEPGVAK